MKIARISSNCCLSGQKPSLLRDVSTLFGLLGARRRCASCVVEGHPDLIQKGESCNTEVFLIRPRLKGDPPNGGQPFVRGFSGIWAKSTGKLGKIPEIFFDFSLIFEGFSGPDFAKISAAVLRIFLVRSRAPETNI